MALLEVNDVHAHYGNIHALKGVSLTVDEGEIVSLIGGNGAGKTTTLRTISGLMQPSSGSVTLAGEDLSIEMWHAIFGFSERTFMRHGMAHYLNAEFFRRVSQRLPETVVVKLAERDGDAIAAAIFFEGGNGLYGRYWGSAGYEDCLHFEACYYQGIEHCIDRGLQFFDPGTQGEHKLARGFEPTVTTSAHWLVNDGLANAIGRYLERERAAVDEYVAGARRHLPFKHSGDA